MTKYIVLEGIDGSGKTSLSNNLDKWLNENGYPCVTVREPYDKRIKEIINFVKEQEPRNEDEILANLFAADRLILKDKIFEYLYEGIIVISDRSKFSSYAYQSVDLYYNTMINQYMVDPHAIFHLDISPEIAAQRYKEEDKFENSVLLEKVRQWYCSNLPGVADSCDAVYDVIDTGTNNENEVLEFFVETMKMNNMLGEKNG